MSEERNNTQVTPEFKMYITDLETNKDSKEIDVSDLIFDDYIEFEFGDYEDEDYETLPYKDFKFFINDYSVTFYSPQMKDLQQKVEQLEKENIKQKEIIENLTTMTVCGDKKQIKNTAQHKLDQLENIRKEAIEYIDEHIKYECDNAFNGMQFFSYHLYDFNKQTLLNILNKGSDKKCLKK